MTEQAANASVAPFARVFVLTLQVFEFGGQMAFQAILARLDVQVLSNGWHCFGFVAGGKEIQAADYDNNDQNKKQVAWFHLVSPEMEI